MDPENAAPVAVWAAERLYWVFLGLIFLNVLQRKHQKYAQKKRMATLSLAIGLFLLLVAGQTINVLGGSDWMFYVAVAFFGGIVYIYRDQMLPFRLRSAVDGRWLQSHEILFDDAHGDGPKDENASESESEADSGGGHDSEPDKSEN
ncbi:MAG: hypothetical protein PF508_12970 [Spirochaeta sp.]|jgi:hypothetical protein|nr:hypothetical protein [Spirochaeta sp.]